MGVQSVLLEGECFMDKINEFPLLIVFLWHPEDKDKCKNIIDYCVKKLSRDRSNLFSHTINIPIRFCSSKDNELPKYDWTDSGADKVLLFCFSSMNLINSYLYGSSWVDYIKSKVTDNVELIGIALDETGYNLSSTRNFIRMSDYNADEYIYKRIFLAIAHRIYRNGLGRNKLKIFLSHTKADDYAVGFARYIKSYIDSKSDMRTFFDVTSIEVGADFDNEIDKGIKGASLLAINSDHYSGSYWCQKEILKAHDNDSPYIVVDMLQNYEDRSFPYLSNCPVIRVESKYSKLDILRALECILLETIRNEYALIQLNLIKNMEACCAHPPALYDLIKIQDKKSIYYPYPEVFEDEKSLLLNRYDEIKTPKSSDRQKWDNVKVGISISNSDICDLLATGIERKHLKLLAIELVGYFIGNNAKIVYGGDFRQNGFTRYLREEAEIQKNRSHTDKPVCMNYISWPYYLKSKSYEEEQWKAKCYTVMKLETIKPPKDLEFMIDEERGIYIAKNSERYVKTRCLTKMRNEMIDNSDIRIIAGGKITGYSGIMPGVLEEVLIAIKAKKPIYLIGGFGGITAKICQMMLGNNIPTELKKEWQMSRINMSDDEKSYFVNENEKVPNYEEIEELLKIDNLKNGLSEEENKLLFVTPSTDVIINLISKGYGEKYSRCDSIT